MIVQMTPMLIIAGLSAGWLAEAFLRRGGFGLIADMGLGLVGGIAVGWAVLALATLPLGMISMLLIGFVAASAVIVAQRLSWRSFSSPA